MACDAGFLQKVEAVLRSEPWNRRSVGAVAAHCGCSKAVVSRLRKKLGLTPEEVEVPDGKGGFKVLRTRNIGTKCGRRTLRPEHHELIGKAMHIAERMAAKLANNVLSENDLMSVAHDSLIVSALSYRASEPGANWLKYARYGIRMAFGRAFHEERERIGKLSLFGYPENEETSARAGELLWTAVKSRGRQPIREKPQRLSDRLKELSPRDRLVAEWMAGLDGTGRRDATYIAKFLGIPLAKAQELVDSARKAMAG